MADLGPLNIDVPKEAPLSISTFVPSLIGGTKGASAPKVNLNQPRAITGYANKYLAPDSYMNQLRATAPSYAVRALQDYDAYRASQGQSPLSEEQSQRALQTIATGEPATPEPKRSWWNIPGNAVANIGDILKSLPRLPGALVATAADLPLVNVAQGQSTVASEWGKVFADTGGNPLKIAENISNVPGINLFPGAYTAGNLTRPAELVRNPVFTALDVLPIASQAAKGTKVAKAAIDTNNMLSELGVQGAVSQGMKPLDILKVRRLAENPLRTWLTNSLDDPAQPLTSLTDDGLNLRRTGLGDLVDEFAKTKPIQAYSATFGRQARDAMFIFNTAIERVRGIMQGTIKPTAWDDEVKIMAGAGEGMEQLARRAVETSEQVRSLVGDDADMADLYRRMQESDYAGMTPDQMAAMELVNNMNHDFAEWATANGRNVMFRNEIYDEKTGAKLHTTERQVKMATHLNDLRNMVLSGQGDLASLVENLTDAVGASRKTPRMPGSGTSAATKLADLGSLSNKEVKRLFRATIAAIESAGYDAQFLRDAWNVSNNDVYTTVNKVKKLATPRNPHALAQALDTARDMAQQGTFPRHPFQWAQMDEIVDYLQPLAGKTKEGQRIRSMLMSLANGDWKSVTDQLDKFSRMKNSPVDKDVIANLRHLRDQGQTIQRDLAGISDDSVRKATEGLTELINKNPPARFIPLVNKRAKEIYLAANNQMDAEAIINATDTAILESLPDFDKATFRKAQREAAATWQSMRDDGLDPKFLHSVSPNKAAQVLHPQATVIPVKPSTTKARTLDMTPAVQNIALSLTDQAREYLSQKHIELAIAQMVDQYSVPLETLRAKYLPLAQERARINPSLTVDGHLQALIQREYRRFNPEETGYNWGSPYLKKLQAEQPFIPAPVYRTLKDTINPKSLLGGVLDPITGTFRMAVTSLSLRTQLYNIIGGAVATELQNPGAMLRNSRKAYRMARGIDEIPEALKPIIGSQKHILLDMDRSAIGAVHTGVYAYLKGKMLRRLLDDTGNWRWADRDPATGLPDRGPVRRALTKVSDVSYGINGAVDDFYRMTTYLDEYDRAVKHGADTTVAEARAIGSVRKTYQDWLSQTPFERAVMKSIFPFYGFMSYAMRFILRYPIDHPFRASMMQKIGEAESEELDTLPSRFLSSLFFGDMGDNGSQNALNVGPMNPFSDVANYMTLQGALGATNPLIQTMLEMVGVDQGEQSLYPSLRYDPETGRLSAKSGNPLMAMIENTIPQTALITSILGINTQFNDALKRDPASANRMLASALTLPIPWRKYNVPQEEIKAEVARGDAMEKVKNEAIKTGDWSEALAAYPSLREYMNALNSMPEGQLAPYTPLDKNAVLNMTLPQAQTYSGVPDLDELVASGIGGTLPSIATPYSPADAGITMLRSRGGI